MRKRRQRLGGREDKEEEKTETRRKIRQRLGGREDRD